MKYLKQKMLIHKKRKVIKVKICSQYWQKAKNTILLKSYPGILTSTEIPKSVTEQFLLSLHIDKQFQI